MIRLFALLVSLIVAAPPHLSAQVLKVHFLDVGQGDAVLIEGPAGPTVLYDGGESPTRIIEHLTSLGVSRLDLVIASHNHADHIGGLAEVIRRYSPRFYLDNGVPSTTLTYARLLETLTTTGTQLLEPTRRDIAIGNGASLTVLPPPGIPTWDQNDNAVGVLVQFGPFRLSLGGDAERREWEWWLQHEPDLIQHVQVHKGSHHGSTNGDTISALSRLTPEVVVVSVGQNNGYGHPRREALQMYAEIGATTYRTDLNGTVLIEAQASGQYAVRIERGEGAKPPPGSKISAGKAPR